MRKRVELLAHIQNTASQYNLQEPLGRIAKARNRVDLLDRFDNPAVRMSVAANLDMIDTYDWVLAVMEQEIIRSAKEHNSTAYGLLKTIPGVGWIIALNLLYEIEDINRFPRVQDFASYCRLVKCAKESNGKKYGTAGRKIGNAHLRWAFSEAAQLFLKGNKRGQRYLQKIVTDHGANNVLFLQLPHCNSS